MIILIKTLQVIAALSLLIILHEGGHFLFAKLFKTRVEKFYLFFNYKFHLFSTYDTWFRRLCRRPKARRREDGEYEYEGTEYGIGWIPLGGYVKIAGMIDESMDKEQMKLPPQPYEFRTKPAWQRLLIMLGGIIMNFIAAFVIYAMMLFTWGQDNLRPEDMTHGMKFSAAAKADGFRDGDILTGVDGEHFENWGNVDNIRALSNASTATVIRDGHIKTFTLPRQLNLLEMIEQPLYVTERIPLAIDSITPDSPAASAGLCLTDSIESIGDSQIADFNDLQYACVSAASDLNDRSTAADSLRARTVKIGIVRADSDCTLTAVLTPEFTLGVQNRIPDYPVTHRDYAFFESFPAGVSYGANILRGYVNDMKYVFTKKGARSVGGFIAIGNIFPSEWSWQKFWSLTALLSIMLGFMNVLPIPALDGGHALFAIYEIVTRRRPSDRFLERAQVVGMCFLFALLIFANLNDILRLFGI